jgi:hypothetical protein
MGRWPAGIPRRERLVSGDCRLNVGGRAEFRTVPGGPSEPVGYRHRKVGQPGLDSPLVIEGIEAGLIPATGLSP